MAHSPDEKEAQGTSAYMLMWNSEWAGREAGLSEGLRGQLQGGRHPEESPTRQPEAWHSLAGGGRVHPQGLCKVAGPVCSWLRLTRTGFHQRTLVCGLCNKDQPTPCYPQQNPRGSQPGRSVCQVTSGSRADERSAKAPLVSFGWSHGKWAELRPSHQGPLSVIYHWSFRPACSSLGTGHGREWTHMCISEKLHLVIICLLKAPIAVGGSKSHLNALLSGI